VPGGLGFAALGHLFLEISMLSELLSAPGDYTRGLLSGQLGSRVSGRGMLENWGLLGENKPGLDWGDVAGFAAGVATDPLTYAIPWGLGKLGKVLGGGAKAMEAAAPIESTMSYESSPLAAIMQSSPGSAGGEAVDDFLAGMEQGANFTGKWFEQGGNPSAKIALHDFATNPDAMGRIAIHNDLISKLTGGNVVRVANQPELSARAYAVHAWPGQIQRELENGRSINDIVSHMNVYLNKAGFARRAHQARLGEMGVFQPLEDGAQTGAHEAMHLILGKQTADNPIRNLFSKRIVQPLEEANIQEKYVRNAEEAYPDVMAIRQALGLVPGRAVKDVGPLLQKAGVADFLMPKRMLGTYGSKNLTELLNYLPAPLAALLLRGQSNEQMDSSSPYTQRRPT